MAGSNTIQLPGVPPANTSKGVTVDPEWLRQQVTFNEQALAVIQSLESQLATRRL